MSNFSTQITNHDSHRHENVQMQNVIFDILNKKRNTGVDFIYSIILKLAAHIIVNIMNKLTTERVDRASLA